MSKDTKDTEQQELPRNPQEYSYAGDEEITIPASMFLSWYRAIDAALRQGTKTSFPTAVEWISTSTHLPVENPTAEDKAAGKVAQIMSVEKTFSRENMHESFEAWLYPDVIQAKDSMIAVHSKSVDAGIATKITELQERAKAKYEAEQEDKEEN